MIDKPDDPTLAGRLALLLARPDLLSEICSHVANGGTLITLAETWDVRFSDLTEWLHADEARDRAYIKALNDRTEWSKEMFLAQLRSFARLDISRAFNEDGSFKSISEIPKDIIQAVEGFEIDELWEGQGKDRAQVGVTKKMKFLPKLRAIELAMKNAGLLVERHVMKTARTMEELLAESNKEEAPASEEAAGDQT